MEIVTYVIKGAITHQDRLGQPGPHRGGRVQVMSAGHRRRSTPSTTRRADDLFQIWIKPQAFGAAELGSDALSQEFREGSFQLLASGGRDDGVLMINADAKVFGATVKAGQSIGIDLKPHRHLYLVPSGRVRVNGVEAGPRDGVAITGELRIDIEAEDDGELVLVDAR